MAKSKKNRVITTRRLRIPNGHERVELILPKSTCERIGDHILRNEGLTLNDFLKKAIYNALPVHYEVTEDFVLPFGKYQGETAGTVARLDPSYIEWCKKNIQGFKDRLANESATTEVAKVRGLPHIIVNNITEVEGYFRPLLRSGESIKTYLSGKVWAHLTSPWGQMHGWRRLGTWSQG